jgi:hypothetical protein
MTHYLNIYSCSNTDATSVYEVTYSIEKYAAINPVKECLLPMAFQDSALFHTILACADIYVSPNSKSRIAALTHFSKAVRVVNERLLKPVPEITDGTIVVVCSLAYAEVCWSQSFWFAILIKLELGWQLKSE